MKLKIRISFLSYCLLAIPKMALGLEFSSGLKKVHLVELYTSQSCSSCPPAERWMNQLKTNKQLWKKFVPISFHVTYWNHLSWKDTFSRQQFSNRQRDYNRKIHSGVYTPQVILDGSDFRSWRGVDSFSSDKTNSGPGNLKVSVDLKSGKAKMIFNSTVPLSQLICFAANLESNHLTKITSGENRGEKISQDFIVTTLKRKLMERSGREFKCNLEMKVTNEESHFENSLAFWIIDKNTYTVIQATGGNIK